MAQQPKKGTKQQEAPKPGTPAVVTKQAEAPKAAGTDVVLQGTEGMILQGDKADLSHIKPSAGRGNENVGQEDLTMPRLEIVQSQSKCLQEGAPEYIAGAKPGDLINSVSRVNYGKEAFVVNCHYSKMWLVWKDFDKGGGFFGAFSNPAEASARLKEVAAGGEKAEDLEVLDTPQHMLLLVDHRRGVVDELVVALPRTKAGISRDWNTMIRLTGQDRFARVYRVTTALETNKKNQSYWNFVVAQSGMPNKVLYERAERIYNDITAGRRQVVMNTAGMTGAGEPALDGSGAEM